MFRIAAAVALGLLGSAPALAQNMDMGMAQATDDRVAKLASKVCIQGGLIFESEAHAVCTEAAAQSLKQKLQDMQGVPNFCSYQYGLRPGDAMYFECLRVYLAPGRFLPNAKAVAAFKACADRHPLVTGDAFAACYVGEKGS